MTVSLNARLASHPACTIMGRAAFVACLALPPALLHARAVAEMLIATMDLLFLARCCLDREAGWLRQPFAVAAGAWWLWVVVCSALDGGGLLLALLAVRLPLLAVALGEWVLADGGRRRAVWLMLAAAACWIGLQSWEQYLTGHNLFGQPRYVDGALTGPFRKPRAGPALILLFFPVLVPATMALLARPGMRSRLGAVALAVLATVTLVLIGQRMPTVLMLFGLAACFCLAPRLRLPAALAIGAGVILAAALPWVSPPTYAKLVQQTAGQMAHFPQSDYGLIFIRAVTVWQLHPWMGLGFDGFRRGCSVFWTMHGVGWLGVPDANYNGGLGACNIHPHNYYLEALDNAGLPGLVLFAAMVLAAMARLGRFILARPAPLQVGAWVGALVALWPVASTSAFTSMPNGGWVFLVFGLGFAAAGRTRPSSSGEATRTKICVFFSRKKALPRLQSENSATS